MITERIIKIMVETENGKEPLSKYVSFFNWRIWKSTI